jgi:hypothetical protein
MGKYNEELTKAGVLLDLSGLHPSAEGVRVKYSGGKTTVVNGPFAEAKDIVAGYWILQVKSMDEAIEWASASRSRSPSTSTARRVRSRSARSSSSRSSVRARRSTGRASSRRSSRKGSSDGDGRSSFDRDR